MKEVCQGSPTAAVFMLESHTKGSCSICEAGYLNRPGTVGKQGSQRATVLLSTLESRKILKCPQRMAMPAETAAAGQMTLPLKHAGKQAKIKSFPLRLPQRQATRRKWVSPLISNNLIKTNPPPPVCSAAELGGDSRFCHAGRDYKPPQWDFLENFPQ